MKERKREIKEREREIREREREIKEREREIKERERYLHLTIIPILKSQKSWQQSRKARR